MCDRPSAQPRTVLITGGSGFIGRHITTALVGAGYRVSILDLVEPNTSLASVRWHPGSVTDRNTVRNATTGVDAVVNLAGISPLHHEEHTVWAVNMRGAVEVARASSDAGIQHFVHISSDAVYGPRMGNGVASEQQQTAASGVYGESKAAAEEAVRCLISSAELNGLVLRPFAVVGPGQRVRPAATPLLAAAIEAAVSGEPLHIAGDGEQTRDFVSIADLQAAVLTAIDNRIASETPVNVGSGRDTSINMLVSLVEQSTGRVIKRSSDLSKAASGWRADISRASEVFPTIAGEPLSRIIQRACFQARYGVR